MTNRCFIDSNIFIYAYTDDPEGRTEKSIEFLQKHLENQKTFISTQVINELSSVLYKNKKNFKQILQIVDEINNSLNVLHISVNITKKAIELKEKYKYSWWDSLLLATAIENNCNIYYTEDLQANQIIENKMRVINPLLI